jgi:hypothetical protein
MRTVLAGLVPFVSLILCAQEPDKPLPKQELQEKPASRPTSRPSEPQPATGDEAALALARRVHVFAGGDTGWEKVDNIVVTFAGMRRLLWDVSERKVRIESVGEPRRDGWSGAVVYDIATEKAEQLVAPQRSRGQQTDPARAAKGMWINDFYWLLVPLKVLDPGVALSIEPRAKDDAEGVARLRLRFDDVGLTPRNEYVLHVETETGKVVRWDYHSTADAPAASWRFAGYTQVGPLQLSLSRPRIGEGRAIELTDVAINVAVPEGIWTDKALSLATLK